MVVLASCSTRDDGRMGTPRDAAATTDRGELEPDAGALDASVPLADGSTDRDESAWPFDAGSPGRDADSPDATTALDAGSACGE